MTTLYFERERIELGELGPKLVRLGLAAGLAGLAATVIIAFAEGDSRRVLFAYLLNFVYFATLTAGALFFVIIQHLVRAGWSVVVRRFAEAVASNAWLVGLMALPVLFGASEIYEWTHEDVVAADPILSGKAGYLNMKFFLVRAVVYIVAWVALARFFFRRSTAQDGSGDVALTLQMERRAAPALIVFALTLTFFSFDFVMSLDPHWFSTIFGVYVFAGSTVGFYALAALAAQGLQRTGRLQGVVTPEHLHDLGKLVFAFVVFWAYIAFSQYMLIWYANIPEETGWLIRRQTGGWGWMATALIFGHFLVPFLFLMSRHVKRLRFGLGLGAAWVLVMHWIDLYWVIMPELRTEGIPLHLTDLTAFVGLGGIYVALAARRLGRHPLIPVKDPRLPESVAFENV